MDYRLRLSVCNRRTIGPKDPKFHAFCDALKRRWHEPIAVRELRLLSGMKR